MANDNQPIIRVLGFKTTYEKLPVRDPDPLPDNVDDKGFQIDAKGRRVMTMQAEDWAIYSPSHSPLNTKNIERIRHLVPDPERVGTDDDGSKLAFMAARWAQIEPSYLAWKRGQDLPQTGTPLSVWPGVNADQVEVLRQVGIRSVEELRDLSETQIDRVRLPNMRDMRNQARHFLENMAGADAAAREADKDREMEAMRQRLADMEAKFAELPPVPPSPDIETGDEASSLRAALDAAGIDYDRRWGVPKLRSLLPAEAA